MSDERWFDAEQAEGDVLFDLQRKLLEAMDLNAALGYQVDPRYPAPEVFDRPGWQWQRAPTGCQRFEIATLPDCGPLWWGEKPAPFVRRETFIVEPLVVADVEWASGRYWYGLGVHVPTRQWIVFHGIKAAP